ncbi:MAG: adenylate/guanylate cyclase domain-containing protein [Gracilimonas sp.]|nr:adenylate/guanylate cyclase domain-containing protein [Gracilimonas sp.]
MMKNQFFSLRWKLLAGFVGLVLTTVLILLFSASQILESRIRQDIDTNFREAGRVFERIQDVRFRQLRQTAILLADIPSLKAAISTGDTTTVNHVLREDLLYLLDFDPILPDSLIPAQFYTNPDSAGLLIICDNGGKPLGQLSTTPLPEHSIADRAGIGLALNGGMPSQSYIWQEGQRYFNVITIPVWSGNQLEGTLSYGFPIRQAETEQLSNDMGLEVMYYVDNQLVAGSFDEISITQKNILSKNIHTATFDVLKDGQAATTEVALGSENWLVYIAPMFQKSDAARGIDGYYAVAKSLTNELIPLQNLQWMVFAIGLFAVIGAIAISIWITGRITSPIYLLLEGVKRVENEDFSKEVPITSRDEISELTRAFNALVEGLQERLLMLKFVSEATLDAIKKNLSRIEPGGERRDIAVLFSDIRGFTAWSEQHTPEEVTDMLNNLLSYQADLVHKYGGDVDKFVGDELVAVFQGEDKEQKAVHTAIQIQRQLRSLLQKKEKDLAVGIGINSGEVIMGAMGSENRMDFTVLGNTVNLGARLCSAAQKHQILISETVYLNLERKIPVLELDSIKVKGIEKAVQIFEIEWEKEKLITVSNE